MSAVLRPPKAEPQQSRGRGRGRGSVPASRGRGRGRGAEPPKRVGGELINVGVILRYSDGSTDQGRYRWPPSITERGALSCLLRTQNSKNLSELVEIQFSQIPRAGVSRISWLDHEPNGRYYFNQDLYGEGGLQTMINEELRDRMVEYSPDDVYTEQQQPLVPMSHARVGPVQQANPYVQDQQNRIGQMLQQQPTQRGMSGGAPLEYSPHVN